MQTRRLSRVLFSITFAVSLLCGMFNAIFAQNSSPDGTKRITTVEGITEYQLQNGLRVLLFPDQTKQTITSTGPRAFGQVEQLSVF